MSKAALPYGTVPLTHNLGSDYSLSVFVARSLMVLCRLKRWVKVPVAGSFQPSWMKLRDSASNTTAIKGSRRQQIELQTGVMREDNVHMVDMLPHFRYAGLVLYHNYVLC